MVMSACHIVLLFVFDFFKTEFLLAVVELTFYTILTWISQRYP